MPRSAEWFTEELGLIAEADGLPRIAGRLLGFLLLRPGPCSLDEIAAALGASKGSVSTDARLLLRHRWLRRVSLPGDRRDYYEMTPDCFAEIVAYRLARWNALHGLVAEARRRMPAGSRTTRARLRYLDEAQRFFLDGIHGLLTEWRAMAPHARTASSSTGAVATSRSRSRA